MKKTFIKYIAIYIKSRKEQIYTNNSYDFMFMAFMVNHGTLKIIYGFMINYGILKINYGLMVISSEVMYKHK